MGSLGSYSRLLRENQNFRRLWLAQIVSEIGDWFYALAVYSLILELTGSAKLVGLAVVMLVGATITAQMGALASRHLSGALLGRIHAIVIVGAIAGG